MMSNTSPGLEHPGPATPFPSLFSGGAGAVRPRADTGFVGEPKLIEQAYLTREFGVIGVETLAVARTGRETQTRAEGR